MVDPMKRQKFRVALYRGTDEIARDESFAHNSGVRKSEALVRAFAREHDTLMIGASPHRNDEGYSRQWTDGTHTVIAVVIPIS